MNRPRTLFVAPCLAVALILSLTGCSSDTTEDSSAKTETGTSVETTAPERPESAVATSGSWAEPVDTLSGNDVYLPAAKQFGFALYEPTYLPAGFEYIPTESAVRPDLVAVVYGSGDARLLIIQGIWDIGDDPDMTTSNGAMWGTSEARYVEGMGFAWEGPAYGEDAQAVFAPTLQHGSNAAIMGVGIEREELLTVGESMVSVAQ